MDLDHYFHLPYRGARSWSSSALGRDLINDSEVVRSVEGVCVVVRPATSLWQHYGRKDAVDLVSATPRVVQDEHLHARAGGIELAGQRAVCQSPTVWLYCPLEEWLGNGFVSWIVIHAEHSIREFQSARQLEPVDHISNARSRRGYEFPIWKITHTEDTLKVLPRNSSETSKETLTVDPGVTCCVGRGSAPPRSQTSVWSVPLKLTTIPCLRGRS